MCIVILCVSLFQFLHLYNIQSNSLYFQLQHIAINLDPWSIGSWDKRYIAHIHHYSFSVKLSLCTISLLKCIR